MKNIHLIPTDKVSRLYLSDYGKELNLSGYPLRNYITGQHIYITSDEEPKHLDYYFDFEHQKVKECETGYYNKGSKKIILTTDEDLIEDGVQAIDDEFLEWYVKNPRCEEVDVEIETTTIQLPQQQLSENSYDLAFRCIDKKVYKIIIPKEEPKQITSLDGDGLGGIPKGILTMLIGEKEETLEQAAEKYVKINVAKNAAKLMYKEHFIAGAKWQQEQFKNESTAHYIDRHIVEAMVEVAKQKMYSEEETEELIIEAIKRTAQYCNINKLYGDTIEQFSKEWFNENKKK